MSGGCLIPVLVSDLDVSATMWCMSLCLAACFGIMRPFHRLIRVNCS
jgi:hypothetical protein